MKTDKFPYWVKIGIGIVACNLVGLMASTITFEAIPGWYAQLNKPFFNPPNWLFGPVWILLYTLMGISAAAIWQVGTDQNRIKHALSIFGIQLLLNAMWSYIFFGFKSPLLAFVEIICLLIVIIYTFRLFKEINPWAGWILIPYIFWVTFAAALNLAIYVLN